jgi:hypothetical protein
VIKIIQIRLKENMKLHHMSILEEEKKITKIKVIKEKNTLRNIIEIILIYII